MIIIVIIVHSAKRGVQRAMRIQNKESTIKGQRHFYKRSESILSFQWWVTVHQLEDLQLDQTGPQVGSLYCWPTDVISMTLEMTG